MKELTSYEVDKEYLCSVVNNNEYNKIIFAYYERLYNETILKLNNTKIVRTNLLYKLDRLKNCNKMFNINIYEQHKVKDFLSTNLCHDKFCSNCKKVRQASRMSRYIPYMDKYSDNLYHLTLTIPNVSATDLNKSIKRMSLCFRSFIRLIKGKDLPVWLNLPFRFKGAVRSLEITFSDKDYHPHYHVALCLSDFKLDKNIINRYSYDNKKGRDVRYFSDIEITIQKIWYMLFNNIRLTKDNFDDLKVGYSCSLNKFDNSDYAELFKYLCKETKEDSTIMSYDNFKTLYYSTFNIKQIQGYGCFYQISDKNIDDEINIFYNELLEYLNDELPFNKLIDVSSLLNDFDYQLISRKKIYKYIKEVSIDDIK